MKIAFFALARREHGGIYQYTLSAIEAFKKLSNDSDFDITFIYSPDYIDAFHDDSSEWRVSNLTTDAFVGDRLLATYLGSGMRRFRREEFDLVVSSKTCLIGYRTGRQFIVTLHDLLHKHYPRNFQLYRRILRDVLYSRSAKLSDLVICETNSVKSDIVNFYNINPEKISVLPSPPPGYIYKSIIDPSISCHLRNKYNLPDEYLFYPAQFWVHKNHIKLFESLYVLKSAHKIDLRLVLTGSAKESFKAAMQKMKELGLASNIMYLGYVPEHEIPYLFKLSQGLVLPTLFESLSIPMWEAFWLEVPVACSNICSLPEQAGNAAIFFNPHDPEDMARAISELLLDQDKRKTLVIEGKKRIKNMSIENYAESWRKIIRELVHM